MPYRLNDAFFQWPLASHKKYSHQSKNVQYSILQYLVSRQLATLYRNQAHARHGIQFQRWRRAVPLIAAEEVHHPALRYRDSNDLYVTQQYLRQWQQPLQYRPD